MHQPEHYLFEQQVPQTLREDQEGMAFLPLGEMFEIPDTVHRCVSFIDKCGKCVRGTVWNSSKQFCDDTCCLIYAGIDEATHNGVCLRVKAQCTDNIKGIISYFRREGNGDYILIWTEEYKINNKDEYRNNQGDRVTRYNYTSDTPCDSGDYRVRIDVWDNCSHHTDQNFLLVCNEIKNLSLEPTTIQTCVEYILQLAFNPVHASKRQVESWDIVYGETTAVGTTFTKDNLGVWRITSRGPGKLVLLVTINNGLCGPEEDPIHYTQKFEVNVVGNPCGECVPVSSPLTNHTTIQDWIRVGAEYALPTIVGDTRAWWRSINWSVSHERCVSVQKPLQGVPQIIYLEADSNGLALPRVVTGQDSTFGKDPVTSPIQWNIAAPHEIPYTPTEYPAIPTGLKVVETTDTTITLEWERVRGATQYQIRYWSQTTVEWSWMVYAPDTSVEIRGLHPNTDYQFQISSRNASGWSGFSTTVEGRTAGTGYVGPTQQLEAPVINELIWLSSTILKVGWTGSSPPAFVESYDIDISTTEQFPSDGRTNNTQNRNTSFEGLTSNTRYWVRVRANAIPGSGFVTSNNSTVENTETPILN